MDICTASVSPTGCGHHTVTIDEDGVPAEVAGVHAGDLVTPLTPEEKALRRVLNLRVWYQRNAIASLPQAAGRVIVGEEATNVKVYDLIGPGAGVTKTNIGTAYVDILPGLSGQRTLIDFTGCTQYRLTLTCNLIGTGAFGLRVVRDSDTAVLHENAALGSAGQRELDTGWLTLPAQAAGLIFVRVQGKSVTAADDPVFYVCRLAVR